MRLLADENFPGIAVETLREAGHDVAWIRTDAPGSSDPDVLERAQAERRLVVTFDKDFGELAFRHGLPAECGIILFRLPTSTPERVAEAAVKALASDLDFAGHFVVVGDTRVRSTPLPGVRV